MKLLGDLQDVRLMYLKAFLFLVLGAMAVTGLLLESPTSRTAILLLIAVWAFCRLYYFAFYVVEKYIDPAYKFSGLHSVVLYLVHRRMRNK